MKNLYKITLAVAIGLVLMQGLYAQIQVTPNTTQNIGEYGGNITFSVTPDWMFDWTTSINDWWWYGNPVTGCSTNPSSVAASTNPYPPAVDVIATIGANLSVEPQTIWFVAEETFGTQGEPGWVRYEKHVRIDQAGAYVSFGATNPDPVDGKASTNNSFYINTLTTVTISTYEDWITLQTTSIENRGEYWVKFDVLTNNPLASETRIGYIKVVEVSSGKYQMVKITQNAGPGKIHFTDNAEVLQSKSIVAASGASNVGVGVASSNGATWDVWSAYNWTNFQVTEEGFSFSALENTGKTRANKLTVITPGGDDLVFYVKQHGTAGTFSIDPVSYEFAGNGGDKEFAITSTDIPFSCYTVTSNQSWLTADEIFERRVYNTVTQSWEYPYFLRLSASKNWGDARSAIVTVTPLDGTPIEIALTQLAGEIGLQVDSTIFNLPASIYTVPGVVNRNTFPVWTVVENLIPTYKYNLTANTSWTAVSSNPSFVTPTKSSGTGSWEEILTFKPNTTTTERTATITYTPSSGDLAVVTINQAAGIHTLTTSVKNDTVDHTFHNNSIVYTMSSPTSIVNSAGEPVVISDSEWLIAQSYDVSPLKTDWNINVTVYNNNSKESRTAIITITPIDGGMPETITVVQEGDPNAVVVPESTFIICPSAATFPVLDENQKAYTTTILSETEPEILKDNTWIIPMLKSSVSGTYIYEYQCLENPYYGTRYAFITYTPDAGDPTNVTVMQTSGLSTPTFALDFISKEIKADDTLSTFKITSNLASWDVFETASWLDLKYGIPFGIIDSTRYNSYGNRTITLSVEKNTTHQVRSTDIIIVYVVNDTDPVFANFKLTQTGKPFVFALGEVISFTIPDSIFASIPAANRVFEVKLADGSAIPSWLTFSPLTLTFSGTAPLSYTSLDIVVSCSSNAKSSPIVYQFAVVIGELELGLGNLNKAEIKIYPNPTKNSITLDFNDSAIQNINISICDITGKVLFDKTKVFSRDMIDLSFLSKGIYLVKITSGTEIYTTKLIKE